MKQITSTQSGKKSIIVNKAFIVFSCVLFLVISLAAIVTYIISTRQINHSYVEQQLTISSETLRLRLATTVNSELALVLKMADTPAIRQHFIDPEDPEYRAMAQIEFDIFQEHFKDSTLFWVSDANMLFHATGNEPFILDPDDPENYWYYLTMYETEQHNLNINYNPDLHEINLWVNVPVFAATEDGGKRPIGILGTGIDLTEFTNFIVSGESEFDRNITPYMFNKFDEITSAIDYDLVSNKVRLDDLLGNAGKEIIRIAKLLNESENQIFTYEGNMYLVSTIPAMEWFLVVSYPLPGFLALNQAMNAVFFSMLFLIFILFIALNIYIIIKDRREKVLNDELSQERDIIQTMKDNIHQGIFLMDTEFRILPQYSQPLTAILSYYEADLEGKNFLDILATSLDSKQLQTMKGYFGMIFEKSKSVRVLESANPISEFEYKADDRVKTLSTAFHLIEREASDPVIIGIIQDITREKEFEKELQAQREAQELEMKNMFDVIQIDPIVFQDFIEDTDANFNYINVILKDRTMDERQVVTKFFQNVHAMKSNALILGLETFGTKLHNLEDDIKAVMATDEISVDNILSLAVKLETLMQEKDSYVTMVNKIESYKTSFQLDSFLINSLAKAVDKTAIETNKKAELKAGKMDLGILESKLRKPIKDILFQCVRNSLYHGIESSDERIKKHKNPNGQLVVDITNNNGKAVVFFSDDGRGLDWEKIKASYIKRFPDAKEINRKTLLSSIFLPEFSTSEETTIVAGRGVGLSFVKDVVKDNGGTISVNSSDAGLAFTFTFPIPA